MRQIPYCLAKSECLNVVISKQSCIYFIFPIMKGSANALMKFAGFSTANKVKNYCTTCLYYVIYRTLVVCVHFCYAVR